MSRWGTAAAAVRGLEATIAAVGAVVFHKKLNLLLDVDGSEVTYALLSSLWRVWCFHRANLLCRGWTL